MGATQPTRKGSRCDPVADKHRRAGVYFHIQLEEGLFGIRRADVREGPRLRV